MRWTIGRTICLLIGLTLLGICARSAWFSFDWNRRFETWQTEVLARFTLDPASTIEVAATLHHTCTVGHSQEILLRVLNADGTPAPDELWPKRVDANITLDSLSRPDPPREIESSARDYDLYPAMVESQGLVLARPLFGREGDYRLRFALAKPVEAPPGIKYEITVRNLLCGLERMPGFISGVIAAVAGLIGFAFAVPSGVKIAGSSAPVRPG
jgi:hypothetical protein